MTRSLICSSASANTLVELADTFYKNGGRTLYIDEVHRYANWSVELKNIYDTYTQLKVVYTGSSILDIRRGSADLSRRQLEYTMYGLSLSSGLISFKTRDVPEVQQSERPLRRARLFDVQVRRLYRQVRFFDD